LASPVPEFTTDNRVVVVLPNSASPPPPKSAAAVVPDIRGMSVRDAVRTLHKAGFHVGYSTGRSATRAAAATLPAAGSVVRQGTLVRLIP
jgi:beta-lactam-binding protein with PASTA domain